MVQILPHKNEKLSHTSTAWPIPKSSATFFWNEFPWTCTV